MRGAPTGPWQAARQDDGPQPQPAAEGRPNRADISGATNAAEQRGNRGVGARRPTSRAVPGTRPEPGATAAGGRPPESGHTAHQTPPQLYLKSKSKLQLKLPPGSGPKPRPLRENDSPDPPWGPSKGRGDRNKIENVLKCSWAEGGGRVVPGTRPKPGRGRGADPRKPDTRRTKPLPLSRALQKSIGFYIC